MAYRKIEDSKLTAIANAIRGKLGGTTAMTPDEMPSMIDNIGIGAVPSYWATYLATKATEINSALTTAGENKSAFLWYTDAHWRNNHEMSPMILKYLSKHTNIGKTFFGGDISVNTSGEVSMITAWQELVKDIPNHRSVIGNHDNQVTDFSTTEDRADFFTMFNRTGDMAIGTDATNGKMYYYIDNHIEKTRYICLSTGRMWTNEDEITWCIDVLNNTPNGWHIVVISHLWLNNDYDNGGIITTPERYTQVYLDLFDAYNYRESGTTEMYNASYNFTNALAKVEFVIGGHIHQDYDFSTATGIPVILTECDGWQERDDVSVATKGTTTESCVYAIVADYTDKSLKVINVGRGDSRSVPIPDVVTYKNWLPISTDAAGTVYNGKGYKENVYLSGGAEYTANGWYVSGFIPATRNSVIRMKHVTFMEMDTTVVPATNSKAKIYCFNADYSVNTASANYAPGNLPSSAWEPVYDETGNLIQFKIPSSYSSNIKYIRIGARKFNANSIVTVNETID